MARSFLGIVYHHPALIWVGARGIIADMSRLELAAIALALTFTALKLAVCIWSADRD